MWTYSRNGDKAEQGEININIVYDYYTTLMTNLENLWDTIAPLKGSDITASSSTLTEKGYLVHVTNIVQVVFNLKTDLVSESLFSTLQTETLISSLFFKHKVS